MIQAIRAPVRGAIDGSEESNVPKGSGRRQRQAGRDVHGPHQPIISRISMTSSSLKNGELDYVERSSTIWTSLQKVAEQTFHFSSILRQRSSGSS
jgi:hypothetical protein